MGRLLRGITSGVVLAAIGGFGIYGLHDRNVAGMQSAAQVSAKLQDAADAALKAQGHDWARVRIDGQIAILEGEAPSDAAKLSAERAIRTAYGQGGVWSGGIVQVINLASMRVSGPYVWRAQAEEGAVTLRGQAPSEVARIDLVESARELFPKGVLDQMEIKAEGAPNGDWLAAAKAGLSALAKLDKGEAILSDAKITVKGESSRVEARNHASVAMVGVPPQFTGQLDVSMLMSAPATPPAETQGAPDVRPAQ